MERRLWSAWRCTYDDDNSGTPCGSLTWRYCRVCLEWVCSSHRYGSGWWWRCLRCPSEQLAELGRALRIQAREERLTQPWGQRARHEDERQLCLWHHFRVY